MILPAANLVQIHQDSKHHLKPRRVYCIHQLIVTVGDRFHNQDKQQQHYFLEMVVVLQQNAQAH